MDGVHCTVRNKWKNVNRLKPLFKTRSSLSQSRSFCIANSSNGPICPSNRIILAASASASDLINVSKHIIRLFLNIQSIRILKDLLSFCQKSKSFKANFIYALVTPKQVNLFFYLQPYQKLHCIIHRLQSWCALLHFLLWCIHIFAFHQPIFFFIINETTTKIRSYITHFYLYLQI
jgi:hypothetical protein